MAIDKTQRRILAMLEGEDLEKRRAAAIVLGELEVSDKAVVAALLAAMAHSDRHLRLAALHGLRGARSKAAVPMLLALLGDPDEAIRAAAGAAVGASGADVGKMLRKEFATAPASRRRGIVDALAWSRGSESLNTLFAIIAGDEPALATRALAALATVVPEMSASERAGVRQRAITLTTDAKLKKRPHARAVGAALLGEIGRPDDLKILVKLTGGKQPAVVRSAAVGAMRRPLNSAKGKARQAAVSRLVELVSDDDLEGVVRPGLDLLRGVELGEEFAARLLRLAEEAHPVGREFALRHLGEMRTASVGRMLVKHVQSGDQSAREAAATSLRRMPAAVPALVKAITGADSAEAAHWLAGVLRALAESVTSAQKKAIGAAAAEWAAAADPRGDVLADLLRAVDPGAREDALLKKARLLAKRKRFEEAYQTLKPMERDGRLSDQARFELGVFAAKASGKRVAKSRRGHGRGLDESLAPLAWLWSRDYPVVERLFKSKLLTDEDRYNIGFSFLESTETDQQDLGADVLQRIVERSPRTKIGKSARNKLRTAGLMD